MENEIVLTLTRPQVAMLIESLSEFPYKRVQGTIVDIITQVNEQAAKGTLDNAGKKL